jgi:hypothetical protein
LHSTGQSHARALVFSVHVTTADIFSVHVNIADTHLPYTIATLNQRQANPALSFSLYTSPPLIDLKEGGRTLLQERMVPKALVRFRVKVDADGGTVMLVFAHKIWIVFDDAFGIALMVLMRSGPHTWCWCTHLCLMSAF